MGREPRSSYTESHVNSSVPARPSIPFQTGLVPMRSKPRHCTEAPPTRTLPDRLPLFHLPRHMPVFNPDFLETAGKDIDIEPGIAPGARERTDVNKELYAMGLKKADKRLDPRALSAHIQPLPLVRPRGVGRSNRPIGRSVQAIPLPCVCPCGWLPP